MKTRALLFALLMTAITGSGLTASAAAESKPNTIVAAQEELVRLGYDPGRPDGIWGTRTMAAVKAFQVAEGLAPSGELDEATLAALDLGPQQDAPETIRLIPYRNLGWSDPVSSLGASSRGSLSYWATTRGDMVVRPRDINVLLPDAATGDFHGKIEPINVAMPRVGGITRFCSLPGSGLRVMNGEIVLAVGDTLQVGALVWGGQEIDSGTVVVREAGLDLVSFR